MEMLGFAAGLGRGAASSRPRAVSARRRQAVVVCRASAVEKTASEGTWSRRSFLRTALGGAAAPLLGLPGASLAKVETMPGIEGRNFGKERTVYRDFTLTNSGMQYKDVRKGGGNTPQDGDRVVIDWEGYTIGYYGHIFAAKNRLKGGAFQEDQDFYRWIQGKHTVIPALEEAVSTMQEGGIRQVVIPPELGYPPSDPSHDKVGPKPKTFSGQRALDFVLKNQGLVDKTLLINVELIRVDRKGERGFKG